MLRYSIPPTVRPLRAGIAALLAGLLVASAAHAVLLDDLQQEVAQAEHNYDLDAALRLVGELQAFIAENPSVQANLTLARVALLAAEMRRFDYEQSEGKMDPRDRRLLGRTIDDVARIGLDALAQVPESLSEKWRMSADFYGTMIRSNYKGSKYVQEMEHATERAVELDPTNPLALLTQSKRPLFAEENQGGDIPLAMELLNKALELNPKLERAYAFRGVGYEKLGEMNKAIADWRKALELAPESRMAKEKLNTLKNKAN
jgi:tetratricopeptide (TPR) repeat protein